MAAPASPTDLGSLISRFGLPAALTLWQLIQNQGSDVSKGIGAANVASPAIKGGLTAAGAGGVARAVGPALAGAGLGLNLANIAGSNLSNKQKVGAGVQAGGETAIGLTAPPWGALSLIARALVQQLERSGSPQVSETGRTLAAPAAPVEALLNVSSGRQSPRAAGNAMVDLVRGTPFKPVLDLFGLGTKPTTGTMFRREAGTILDRLGLTGVNTSRYNIDPKVYAAFPQAAKDAGVALATRIASLAPDARTNPQAYQNQLSAILLNQYGAALPQVAQSVLPMLQAR
jgi:hypothetical protein